MAKFLFSNLITLFQNILRVTFSDLNYTSHNYFSTSSRMLSFSSTMNACSRKNAGCLKVRYSNVPSDANLVFVRMSKTSPSLTSRNTSGGFHGHQLKDLIGGYTIAKVFGFKYVHTYYPYLEFFGIGFGETLINDLDEEINYTRVGGPFWNGANFENSQKIFGNIKQDLSLKIV